MSSVFAVTFPGFVPASSAAPLSIHVSGNRLVNGSGTPIQLRGVNRSGTEYACDQGWGIFDGPSDDASVAAIASWDTDVVRIPLNEDCWLGINGVNPAFGGANYQQAIETYVSLLHAHGLYAILDLAAAAPGTTLADGLQQMPDQDHSPAFWASVAAAFKDDPATLFDLFNEPYPGNNTTSGASWTCWRDGTCDGLDYQAAGMQELVNTVRAVGADNVILLGGIGFASVLDQWAAYEPTDPAGQLAASLHDYDFGGCTTSACWDATLAAVGNVPLVTGEMGFDGYIETYMAWADARGVGYLAWTWDAWGCDGGQALISDYTGAPCDPYGTGYQQHLAARASTPTHLVFTTQPGGGTAGQAWNNQPVVTIEDADDNTITSDTSPITLTIQANPGSGILLTCSASTVAGVASFSGCQIDKAGTGYVLTATDAADSLTAISDTFSVTPGSPAQLVFSVQPGGGAKNRVWASQPTVTVEDANANTVTSDTSAIALTITSGTGDSKAKLLGCSATTTAGVAVFAGCRINQHGTGYQLTATDGANSLSTTSATFDITARPHPIA